MFATGVTMGKAEGIIDDNCLVLLALAWPSSMAHDILRHSRSTFPGICDLHGLCLRRGTRVEQSG